LQNQNYITDAELDSLRKQRESVNIEFKSKIDEPEKIVKTIYAFANTSGGHLLIGINDDRSVKGISEIPEMEKVDEVLSFVEDIEVEISHCFYQEKRRIIILKVAESKNKPLEFNDEIYIRADDKSMAAGKEMIQILNKYEPNRFLKIDPILKSLRSYLRMNHTITAKHFAKTINYSEQRVDKMLLEYLREGFLMVVEIEKPYYYTLREK
jgi:predicted HTH transcriptional regulator